jgi:hypothetical protein
VTDIDITGGRLVITMRGLDRVWALRSRIAVPLSAVRGATADPGITRESAGFRAPGTHLPGKITAGTYRKDGNRTFWNLRNTQEAVVIELEGQYYTRLVLGVDDARATAERIERSLSRR